MRRKQSGVTFIGWLFLLVPVGLLVYAAIRLTPIYSNYFSVVRAMEQTAKEFKGDEGISAASIQNSLEKRLDIDSVVFPTVKDIGIRREGSTWKMALRYEDIAPLFYNLSILVTFDKEVRVE
ncbi:MAG: DUF4845 domain-containing protein [Steroidobacteraceae bacterium]